MAAVFIGLYTIFVPGPVILAMIGLWANSRALLWGTAILSLPATVYAILAYDAYWFVAAPLGLIASGLLVNRRPWIAVGVGAVGVLPFFLLVGFTLYIQYFVAGQ